MSIKEFSQKNSIALFYATIVLVIAVIVLGSMSFGHKGFSKGNFQRRNQQGMMQNSKTNIPDQNTQVQAPDQTQGQAPNQEQ